VVRRRPLAAPPFPLAEPARVAASVASAFSMRRKTLRNGLRGLVDEAGFGQAGIDAGRRPETLSPAEFGALAATPAPPVAV
jgi:16S rRNA (adenine1518-N6/adenine1519-N6)-dimethyltransferase